MNYLELDWKCGAFIESDAENNEETYHASATHDGVYYRGWITYHINPRTFERTIVRVEGISEDVFNRLANIFSPIL